MTTNQTADPRTAQALDLIARVGGMLSRAERIIRTTSPSGIQRFDLVLRALMQCNHNLSIAYNAALANVPEPKPEPTPEAPPAPLGPSTFIREITARGCDTPEAHAARQREADTVARSIRVER